MGVLGLLESGLFVSIEKVKILTYEFDVALVVNQHMFWLQIAIGNAMFV